MVSADESCCTSQGGKSDTCSIWRRGKLGDYINPGTDSEADERLNGASQESLISVIDRVTYWYETELDTNQSLNAITRKHLVETMGFHHG